MCIYRELLARLIDYPSMHLSIDPSIAYLLIRLLALFLLLGSATDHRSYIPTNTPSQWIDRARACQPSGRRSAPLGSSSSVICDSVICDSSICGLVICNYCAGHISLRLSPALLLALSLTPALAMTLALAVLLARA